jgi:hypothetical protein
MSSIFEKGKFKMSLLDMLKDNKEHELVDKLIDCNIELKNFGSPYYAKGIRCPWNSEGLDIQIYTQADKMSIFTDRDKDTIKTHSNSLFPQGYVIGEVDILPSLEDDISLQIPQTTSQELKILTVDINDAINKNEPSLVLDRLHTFSVKYLRELCGRNGIETQGVSGNKYPLHSLAGSIAKYYEKKKELSEFSVTVMKSFISLLVEYNKIRNDRSYAHDNDILSNTESIFVLQTVSAMLNFLDKIEFQNKNIDEKLPF